MRTRASIGLAAAAALVANALIGSAVARQLSTVTVDRLAPAGQGSGIPDPYYPQDGNLGYEVVSYTVNLDYFPGNHSIRAITTVDSVAKTGLSTFNLDLVGLTVDKITVSGQRAEFTRQDNHELIITPAEPITDGARFSTVVTYHGQPGHKREGAIDSGWHDGHTPGSGLVVGEPHSCTYWYPCNDHPSDKAEFHLVATVPRPFEVASNGIQGQTTSGMRPDGTKVRTFRWSLDERTATYLTMMYIDKLTFERSELPDGTPIVSVYSPRPYRARKHEAFLPEILKVLATKWGPYPAPAAGGVFADVQLGYALETFTRPTYGADAAVVTIVHENGHQWWGDNVSIVNWRDVCLNECFASYSVWLWKEYHGDDLDSMYLDGVKKNAFMFRYPLYDMGRHHEFDYYGVYFKGVYFLHALRNKIGDQEFFTAMRGIQRDLAGKNLSMIGLRQELEERTGVDLTSFWREWVLQTGKPSHKNLYPGDLGS